MPKQIGVAIIENWCKVFRNRITVDQIKAAVMEVFSVSESDLTDSCRNGLLSDARSCYVWYSRNTTNATLKLLAHMLKRDHASVINFKNRADNLLEVGEEKFTIYIKNIHAKLQELI